MTDDGESLPGAIESQGSAMAFLMLASAVAGLALGLVGRRGAGFAVLAGLFGTVALWSKVFDMNSGAEDESGFELATRDSSARDLPSASGEAMGAFRPTEPSRELVPSNRLSQGT